MSDKKKKGLGVSGGYRANQEGIGGGGRVEYVIKNGKVTAVPYVSGSASKSFKKGKPRRAGASTDPRRKNKKALIEAGFTFKEGGMIIKNRQYLKGK